MNISENKTDLYSGSSHTQLRNAIILPDGSKPIPLGSGVITSLLGEGGMANVYEIWNTKLEINRAVKLLHPNCTDEAKQRFQTEMKISAKLHHPNIVEIHGVGEWNSLPFIEMEKIDGYTLEQILQEKGALSLPVCTAIGIAISRALTYAHNQEYVIYGVTYNGIIHRDLKPSNIMVCKNGTVKLMDFGIARPTDASLHTTDGAILGTMQYLSPEQLDGVEPDVRSDIYSLGTTLYEIITGLQAFPERNISKLMMNKIKNEFKPLDDFKIRVMPRLKGVIHKCMSQGRDKRISNAAILLKELEKIHGSITSETPEQILRGLINSESRRVIVSSRRRLPIKTVGSVFLLLIVAVAAYWYVGWGEKTREQKVAEVNKTSQKNTRQSPPEEKIKQPPQSAQAKTIVSASVNESPTLIAPQKPEPKNPEPKVPAPQARSFVQELTDQYATADLASIFVSEVKKNNYLSAIRLYDSLSADQTAAKNVQIYYLRALKGAAKHSALNRFIAQNHIADGEFLLVKAMQAYKSGNYKKSLALLEESLSTPRQFSDPEMFKREVQYYKALCETAIFDKSPTDESYKNALDAWWQLRMELRSVPDHMYNKRAEAEKQRIGEKFREHKG